MSPLHSEIQSALDRALRESVPDHLGRMRDSLRTIMMEHVLHDFAQNGDGNFFTEKAQARIEMHVPRLDAGQSNGDSIAIATNAYHAMMGRLAMQRAKQFHEEQPLDSFPDEIRLEAKQIEPLIHKIGEGVAFFGSARTKPGDPDYDDTVELAGETSKLLGSTIWSGAGPGQMEAALVGANRVGGKIGGIKIHIGGQKNTFEQDVTPVLTSEQVVIVKKMTTRKCGLVQAATRSRKEQRTGIITTPGGFGSADEYFEVIVLKQLAKLDKKFPTPFIVMNYREHYTRLLEWMQHVKNVGMADEQDLNLVKVCTYNREALDCLADFYDIPEQERTYKQRLAEPDGSDFSI